MNLENFNFRLLDGNLTPHDLVSQDYRIDRNFEALITERGESFEESELYSRIFLDIKGLLLSDSSNNPVTESDETSFEEKYLLSSSFGAIDRIKKLVIDINNNKIEADLLFNHNNKEYMKYSQNILSVIENINTGDSGYTEDTELKELLTNKLEWYYSNLNIQELQKKCDSILSEYYTIKRLLFGLSSILPPTICQICISRNVEYFIDPCGHTLCSNCMDKSIQLPKCHFCRNNIHKFKKLYL